MPLDPGGISVISEEPIQMSGPGVASFHKMPGGFKLHAQTWAVQKPIGAVLYLHGANAMIDSKMVRRLANGLNAQQIAFVAYDHDMHGKSMGPYSGCSWCCRGNFYPAGTVGASHALEMAKIVMREQPKPLVLVGHDLGGGTLMLALESIAAHCKDKAAGQLRGAVLLSPANQAELSDACRLICCPLLWPMSKVCCVPLPNEEEANNFAVDGEKNLAAGCQYFGPNCAFCLPESCGGLPGARWWARHHANVPYTILVGTEDDVYSPESQTILRDAAPHGHLDILEGAGHALFTDEEPSWRTNVAAVVDAARQMLGRHARSTGASGTE
mmetsp:Transcript_11479/g.24598  ORF Transcript_11479/g.24598 Transcript_11479/m.24598 type:complete len:327 (+) Transcript_11479:250-1230(+)